MASGESSTKDDWEFELVKAIARRLPGLDCEIFRPNKRSLLLDGGLTLKRWRGGWLAIVRGARVDGGGLVVAFGAGDSALKALRNVSAACQKGEFKRDQFAKPTGGGTNRVSDDPPAPLEGYNVGAGGDFQPPLPMADTVAFVGSPPTSSVDK